MNKHEPLIELTLYHVTKFLTSQIQKDMPTPNHMFKLEAFLQQDG